jgi:tetratricopeptide (TPR) repeat protein
MRSYVGSALLVGLLTTSLVTATDAPNLLEVLESQRALAEENPTPEILNDLANLLVLSGHSNEAESTYRRVLQIDAYNVAAQFNLGLLMQYRGEKEMARELFLEVVEREPTNAWAYYQLGVLHEDAGERAKAIEQYALALAIDPELYFPDVNPQIVNNMLVTESLLEAANLRKPSNLAPMNFARPREITQLLLSLPAIPTGGETGADQ